MPTDSHSYAQNAAVTVLGNTGSLVNTGHAFAGWNTAVNGSGTSYAPGATFNMGAANVTLYAQWTADPTYIVSYNGNDSTGGTEPTDSHSYAQNATVTVLGNTGSLAKTGNTFAGWNTVANGTGTGYAAGVTFSMGAANVTMYVQWTAIPSGDSGVDGGVVTPPDNSKIISQNGQLSLPAGRSGEVRMGDGIQIDIPSNETVLELKLSIEKVLDTQNLLARKEILASPIYEIMKNFSENFSKPVTLTLTFDPASMKDNQRAAIFYYDEAKKEWVEVGGIIIGNRISAEVDHFTKYAVLAVDQPFNENIKLRDISGTLGRVEHHPGVKQRNRKGLPG